MKDYDKVSKIIKENNIKLSNKEQDDLIVKYQITGDVEYRNQVINSLTNKIAQSAFNYAKKTKADVYSLFIEGYYGALWSADRFDSSKNVHFYFLAKDYIKKYQLKLIESEYLNGMSMSPTTVVRLRKNIKEGTEQKRELISTIKNEKNVEVDIYDTLENNEDSVEDVLEEVERKEIVERLIQDVSKDYVSILKEELTVKEYVKQNNLNYQSTLVDYNKTKYSLINKAKGLVAV